MFPHPAAPLCPRSPSWNLIGMMQNSHFIVKMRREEGPDGGLGRAPGCTQACRRRFRLVLEHASAPMRACRQPPSQCCLPLQAAWSCPFRSPAGAQQLRFLHPVANGRDPGGWMVEETQRAGEAEGAPPACLPPQLAEPHCTWADGSSPTCSTHPALGLRPLQAPPPARSSSKRRRRRRWARAGTRCAPSAGMRQAPCCFGASRELRAAASQAALLAYRPKLSQAVRRPT